MNFNFKKPFVSTIVIIILFLAISFTYFSPLIQGKVIKTQDITMHLGMSKELVDYRNEHGKEALWTNRYFSGAPSFLVSTKYPGNLISKLLLPVQKIPRPASYLFISLLLFFILLKIIGANSWISLVGSLAFSLNTAFFVWIDTGHMSKAFTLTFMALLVAGVYYAYNKKIIIGSLIATLALSWMINAGHPQITYYTGFMILIMATTYLIYAIKEKTISDFIKKSIFLLVGALFALGTNYSMLATTMEYGKYSTRGKSELTDKSGNKTTGLDKDYILEYSYDLGETVSAFIPRFKGGGNAESVGEKSNVYKLIAPQDRSYAKRISETLPLYWGSQPISAAPFYFGAVLVFLFVFGLFALKGREKWWLAITVLLAFLLSLGKYFPTLSNFMLDYFPGYNKFRDVKNIIVIEHFAMALLGALAIKEVVARKINDKQFMNALKYSFGITGGFALLFVLIPNLAGDFSGGMDARLGAPEIVDALEADRKMVLRADAFRSFIFVSLAALTLLAYWKHKLKAQFAVIAWGALVLFDMWPIDKKYLNNNDFESERKAQTPIEMTAADKAILQDKSLNYRVLNLTVNPFSDGTTSYYHNSIGGYHGAKLERYQELIEYGISPDIAKLQQSFSTIRTQADVDSVFTNLRILNMLNTKYLIHNPNAQPLLNKSALGNVWFVNAYKIVENADEEVAKLAVFDPKKEALIDKRFESQLEGLSLQIDSSASIKLVNYQPNYLKYESKSSFESLAVFSEIYYPAGWTAKINGNEVPYFRTNYVLRGLRIPSGENTIEFAFHPKTYFLGEKISLASSIVLLFLLMGVVVIELKKKQ
ncbi:MAG: YfhO family protein [Salinivirgaceae bacterium]